MAKATTDAAAWEALWRETPTRQVRAIMDRAIRLGQDADAVAGLIRSTFDEAKP